MIRLDKMLSELGLGSRSDVKNKIRSGAVLVNGKICKDAGTLIDENKDRVLFAGKELHYQAVHTLMLHKPAGVLTAARDSKAQTVMDLLPVMYRASNCMPAGRLDKDTTGLLIITNDGWLAHQLISPSHGIPKQYEALVNGILDESDIQAFAAGIHIHDGDGDFRSSPAPLEIVETLTDTSLARVTICEGKYHQVKRMFASLGHEVIRLRRLSIGKLDLPDTLKEGQFVELTPEQVKLLL